MSAARLKKLHRTVDPATPFKVWVRRIAALTFHDDYEIFKAIPWAKTWLANKTG